MTTTKRLFMLFLAVTLLGGCDYSVTDVKSDAKSTTAKEEATASEESESKKEYLIDVRSKKEWDEDHIDSAINIPHTEIVEGITKVTNDKDAKIFVHCLVGGRADTAMKALQEAGFTNVENLGGLDDAKAHVEKSK